jgi:NADPH:quinone reductase-like Zn-dependent oxidoreductase
VGFRGCRLCVIRRRQRTTRGLSCGGFPLGGRLGAAAGGGHGLLAHGELDPQIGLRQSWEHVTAAAQALLDRRVAGKVVLDVP